MIRNGTGRRDVAYRLRRLLLVTMTALTIVLLVGTSGNIQV